MRQPDCLSFKPCPKHLFPKKMTLLSKATFSGGKHISTKCGGKSIFLRSQVHQVLRDQMEQFLEAYEPQASTVR